MPRQKHRPNIQPPFGPPAVPDVFASHFDVHDFEDWLICLVDVVEPDANSGKEVRREATSIVMPRSSVPQLIKVPRFSIATYPAQKKHS